MTDPHETVQSLLAAYAFHAVEAEEAAEIETHVATCPRCREELDGYLRAAPLLGSVADEAPEGLWAEIRATIGDRRTEAVPSQLRRALGGRRRWPFASPLTAAVVAVVLALGVAVGILASDLAGSPASPGQRLRDAAAAALSGPHTLTPLRTPGGRVVAEVVVTNGAEGFFVPVALPRLPSARTYQLWASVRGAAVSLGTVGARAQVASVHVEPSVHAFMITAEPSGGVAQPDSAVLATGSLST
ncbi:MAG: anti-sigma factor [Acidobacteriota bacterium]|nr:anti-sigma factor [Acidobacteriota bacterium]